MKKESSKKIIRDMRILSNKYQKVCKLYNFVRNNLKIGIKDSEFLHMNSSLKHSYVHFTNYVKLKNAFILEFNLFNKSTNRWKNFNNFEKDFKTLISGIDNYNTKPIKKNFSTRNKSIASRELERTMDSMSDNSNTFHTYSFIVRALPKKDLMTLQQTKIFLFHNILLEKYISDDKRENIYNKLKQDYLSSKNYGRGSADKKGFYCGLDSFMGGSILGFPK